MSEEIQKLKDRIIYFESRILDLNKELDIRREEIQALNLEIAQIEWAAKKREDELLNINKEHQKNNGELIEDNKKLAKQIDDYVSKLRKAGLI